MSTTPPSNTYAVWSAQRTGSTLFCKALELTGVAGTPDEWMYIARDKFGKVDPETLRREIWNQGLGSNGVFGSKVGYSQPAFSKFLEAFSALVPRPSPESRITVNDIWATLFPNCRHIFMTRRNKARLAVSWWRAICSDEWHRTHKAELTLARQGHLVDENENVVDLTDAYDFRAILHLYCEATMREAGMQEFYDALGVVPLTVVYEDFIGDFDATITKVLDYLGLLTSDTLIAPPFFERLADDVSESWVTRFKNQLQADWPNKGW